MNATKSIFRTLPTLAVVLATILFVSSLGVDAQKKDKASDIIGLIEITAAILFIAGYVRSKAGIIGGFITTLMFFTTSTMLLSTPGAIIAVHGIRYMRYMSFLGLFLFKDVIALGVSLYLISHFGERAILAENKN